MYIPVLRKIVPKNDIYIERALPAPGVITSKIGDIVKPFDVVGTCKVSHNKYSLPPDFIPIKSSVGVVSHFNEGSVIGYVGKKKLRAPYNGILSHNTFSDQESSYELMAGVWGVVEKIKDSQSVLLKSQVKDIVLVSSISNVCWGELVVFPNPSEMLLGHYLDEFAENAQGKIIYVGNHANTDIINEAHKRGAKGVLAGSATKDEFRFAKKKGFAFGIFEGFGEISTSQMIFDELKNVSNRFVFFNGDRNVLRVPAPEPFTDLPKKLPCIELLKKAQKVQVLQDPYFGQVGIVDRVCEFSIFVTFGIGKDKPVEVSIPNVLILE